MKSKALMIVMLSGMLTTLWAQQEWPVEKVKVANYGDGRTMYWSNDDKEELLNGKHRIIDGYHSEYLLADFKDGMYDGEYKHYKNSILKESAQYKEGRRHGKTIIYFGGGEKVESESFHKEGKPDGVFKTFNQHGKLLTEKGYKDGLEHGIDRGYHFETGDLIREVTYVNDKREGKQFEHRSGNRGDYNIRSNYRNGQLDGAYSETQVDGNAKIKGTYKAGKKDGRWEMYKKDGLPDKVITYREDKRYGESITYYTDGEVNEILQYADDKKDGLCKEFYFKTGYPKNEYTYLKGKRHGPYKRYYDENNLSEEGRFENDTEVYIKVYFKNGQLEAVKERKPGGNWTYLEFYDSEGKPRKPY